MVLPQQIHPRRLRPGTACMACRRRKLRCSGTPNCERCAANHLECEFDGALFFKTYGPNTFLTKSSGDETLPAATLHLSLNDHPNPTHNPVRREQWPVQQQQQQPQQQQEQQQQGYEHQHPYRPQPQPQSTMSLHSSQRHESILDDDSSSRREYCTEHGSESQDKDCSRGDNDDDVEEVEEEESTAANRYHQYPKAIPPEPFDRLKPKEWTMRIENLLI